MRSAAFSLARVVVVRHGGDFLRSAGCQSLINSRTAYRGMIQTPLAVVGRRPMHRNVAIAIAGSLVLLTVPAWAASSVNGSNALALAALISEHSPVVSSFDKHKLVQLFGGNSNVFYRPGRTITVSADKIVCKTSDVDITLHSCDLTFGTRTRTLTGRKAHELYATIVEVGVPPDAAAGSIFEALSQLTCRIDPNVIDQRAGGGATCNFTLAGLMSRAGW